MGILLVIVVGKSAFLFAWAAIGRKPEEGGASILPLMAF